MLGCPPPRIDPGVVVASPGASSMSRRSDRSRRQARRARQAEDLQRRLSGGRQGRPRSGAWTLAGRGWSATFELSGVRVPHDNDPGPDSEGLKARTLQALLGGDQGDRDLDE